MASKGEKGAGKGPPVISTLPPPPAPAPPKRARKPALDIPVGKLPAPKRKKRAVTGKPATAPAPAQDAFADWDPVRVAAECKAAVLAKAKKARGPIEVPVGAMPVPGVASKRKAKVVETMVEGPMGGKLKRSTREPSPKPEPKEAIEPKPDVPMTDILFSTMLLEISEGVPLRQICRRPDRPAKSPFYRYLDGEDVEDDVARAQVVAGRIARYARARKLGYDEIAEEILDIADDGTNDWIERERDDGSTYEALNGEHVQRSKLRIDARFKLLAKWDPKGYGDALKLGDFDGKPLNKEGRTVSDLAIDMAKLIVAAQREAGIEPSAIAE